MGARQHGVSEQTGYDVFFQVNLDTIFKDLPVFYIPRTKIVKCVTGMLVKAQIIPQYTWPNDLTEFVCKFVCG